MAKLDSTVPFDYGKCQKVLCRLIFLELLHWRPRLEFENIRAFAIECMPWYENISLSLLTEREKNAGKIQDWDTVAWRLFQFTSSPGYVWPLAHDLLKQINVEWEVLVASDNSGKTHHAARKFTEDLVRTCVNAVLSDKVQTELQEYSLSTDFQMMARHGDERERNFFDECDLSVN